MNLELQMHEDNVCKLSMMIGKRFNLNGDKLRSLALGALLHDVGKKYISRDILMKKDKLTQIEMDQVKQHVLFGARELKNKGFSEDVVNAVLYHHERYDGEGYCNGLKGNDIPLLARIITVADSFDAMISSRSYSKPLSIDQAILEIKLHSGKQFDPDVALVFINTIKNKRIKARAI